MHLFPVKRGVKPLLVEQVDFDPNGIPWGIQVEPCGDSSQVRMLLIRGHTMWWTQRFYSIDAARDFADRHISKVNEKIKKRNSMRDSTSEVLYAS